MNIPPYFLSDPRNITVALYRVAVLILLAASVVLLEDHYLMSRQQIELLQRECVAALPSPTR